MSKYILVTLSKIHAKIALKTGIKGYSVDVIESILPTEEEMIGWNGKEVNNWIKQNNKRMESICNFLNQNHE